MSFKTVATGQASLLLVLFVMGSFVLMLPATQPNACEWDFHVRVIRTHHYLVLAVLLAAALLLLVQMEITRAEASAVAAACARAGGPRAKREAAVAKGIGAIAVKWHRASLRALLLLAVLLSFAASLLAVVAFEDGLWFWTGCDARYNGFRAGSLEVVFMIAALALTHGFGACTAVCQN